MTDKQPDALALADALDTYGFFHASASVRTQHAEIERLNTCIKWEQNRAERIGTHGPGCEKWGSAHFECALRAIERKDALLRQALTLCEWIAETQHQRGSVNGLAGQIRYAVQQELSQ